MSFKDIPLSSFLWDWISCLDGDYSRKGILLKSWNPPLRGKFRLNFDGVSKGNPGKAGYGCVLRDHNHKIIVVAYRPLGICNASKVEAISLLMGIRELLCLQIFGCKVEGDLVVVISWGLGNTVGS